MKIARGNMISAVLLSLMLAACGGGGGGDSGNNGNNNGNNGGGTTNPPTVSMVTGVVAVGAPLESATITVKDANGVTKTATTSANGTYSLDISGLKAPLVFEAVGIAGGEQFVIHSVVETISSSGNDNANITPLTDAMVSKMAGKSAVDFYNNPDLSKVNAGSIGDAQDTLKNVLASVMTAAGVGNVDLIKTQFIPNKTGMDAVLETVKVQTTANADGTANVQITNKLNQDQVVTISSTAVAGTISQSNLPDIRSIDAFVESLNASVKTKDAVNSLFPKMYDDNYLEDSENKAGAVSRNQDAPELVGAVWSGAVIDTCNSTGDVCKIGLTMTFADGSTEASPLTIKKQADGSWKLYGNHVNHIFAVVPSAQRFTRANTGEVIATKSGIRFYIDANVGYVRSAILFLQNDDGSTKEIGRLTLKPSICNTGWLAVDTPAYPKDCSNFIELNDTIIAGFTEKTANPKFKIVMYTDENYEVPAGTGVENNGVYSNIRMGAMPLKSYEFASAPFPELTQPSVDNVLAFNNTGSISLAWNAKKVAPVRDVKVAVEASATAQRMVDRSGLIKVTQTTLTGNEVATPATTSSNRTAVIRANSADGREYMQVYTGCKAGVCN